MKPKLLFIGEFARKKTATGSATSNFEILDYLIKKSAWEILTLAPIFKNESPEDIGLPVVFLPTRYFRSKSFGDILCKYDFKKKIEKFIEREKFLPDMIFIDNGTYFCLIKPEIPKVLSLHGSQKYKFSFSNFIKHPYANLCEFLESYHEKKAVFMEQVKKIIINSEHSKNLLINEYRLPSEIAAKIEFAPRGYNIERFKVKEKTKEQCRQSLLQKLNLGANNASAILSFIGGIASHKGQFQLIQSMLAILKNEPQTILILIGRDAGDLQNCRNFIAQNKLESNVFILNGLSDEEAGAALKATDIYVSASLEGFGINIVEAMALGLPILAWDKGAVKELFISGEQGFLVNNETDFLNKVFALIKDEPSRKKMGFAAENYVVSRYSRDKMAKTVESALSALI